MPAEAGIQGERRGSAPGFPLSRERPTGGQDMLIRKKRGWELPERAATDEAVFWDRRRFAKTIAAGPILAAGLQPLAALAAEADPSAGLYPARRNERYALDRPITDEKHSTTYNNFYEFGADKTIWREAQALKVRPWTVKIDGMVEKPMTLDIDDLLKRVSLEERLYRHRCVEAWSMAVPWTGFPIKAFIDLVEPLASAKYLRMVTFNNPEQAAGMNDDIYPWPYFEGLTLAEATNDLALFVTGIYGHELTKQHGAPIRLVTPWKYGYKSVKSIVLIEFTDTQPTTFWSTLVPSEYDFWANVNPAVPHPRWSQESER